MEIVKDVVMSTSRDQEVVVNGILTSDKKYIVGAVARSWVGQWKPSGTGSGNDTRSIGFGDICILRADDHSLVLGPLGFRSNETRKPSGIITSSVNSFLTDMVGMGKNAKKFSDLLPKEIVSAVEDAIITAVDDLEKNGPQSTNSKLASAASKLANMAGIRDSKIQSSKEAVVEGKTIDDVLPQ